MEAAGPPPRVPCEPGEILALAASAGPGVCIATAPLWLLPSERKLLRALGEAARQARAGGPRVIVVVDDLNEDASKCLCAYDAIGGGRDALSVCEVVRTVEQIERAASDLRASRSLLERGFSEEAYSQYRRAAEALDELSSKLSRASETDPALVDEAIRLVSGGLLCDPESAPRGAQKALSALGPVEVVVASKFLGGGLDKYNYLRLVELVLGKLAEGCGSVIMLADQSKEPAAFYARARGPIFICA